MGFVYHKFVKSNLDVVGFRYSTVCSTDAFYLRDEKADIYEGKIIYEGDGSEAYNHIKPITCIGLPFCQRMASFLNLFCVKMLFSISRFFVGPPSALNRLLNI